MLDAELLFDEMFNLYSFRLKYVKILHGHCMTFSELSAVHELKWFRDLRGGGKHESRTRSSEREGFYLFTPEIYSQATLIRLKNV